MTTDAETNSRDKTLRMEAQFASDDKAKLELTLRSAIRLRDIALLVIGGIAVGGCMGFLAGLPIYGITHSKFAISAVFGICVYASWIFGYNRLSQAQRWDSLRTRFSPVEKKVLILSAIGGVGLVAFVASAAALLKWAGIEISDIPTPAVLPHDWVELPLAFLAIVIIGPLAEELLFRGILLDWLKRKMNVWAAAVILSAIFSLLHANPFSLGAVGWLTFSHRFLLGLTASALAIKYRSLRPSLVIHGTMNAIAVFASVLGAG
jgi:membrane protease YdiL (CAAX protease family)